VDDAAIRGSVGSRGADTGRAIAPDLLELSRRNIGTVVSGNSSPELVAASLVNGAKAVGVNNLGLVCYFGIDTEPIERFRGALRGKSARFGQKDLVLNASGRNIH
jgi:hypothetical protein